MSRLLSTDVELRVDAALNERREIVQELRNLQGQIQSDEIRGEAPICLAPAPPRAPPCNRPFAATDIIGCQLLDLLASLDAVENDLVRRQLLHAKEHRRAATRDNGRGDGWMEGE